MDGIFAGRQLQHRKTTCGRLPDIMASETVPLSENRARDRPSPRYRRQTRKRPPIWLPRSPHELQRRRAEIHPRSRTIASLGKEMRNFVIGRRVAGKLKVRNGSQPDVSAEADHPALSTFLTSTALSSKSSSKRALMPILPKSSPRTPSVCRSRRPDSGECRSFDRPRHRLSSHRKCVPGPVGNRPYAMRAGDRGSSYSLQPTRACLAVRSARCRSDSFLERP